jgi:hypothetical protein
MDRESRATLPVGEWSAKCAVRAGADLFLAGCGDARLNGRSGCTKLDRTPFILLYLQLPFAVGDAALRSINDCLEDEVCQLHHKASKPGIFFKQRDDTVRAIVVHKFFAAKRR